MERQKTMPIEAAEALGTSFISFLFSSISLNYFKFFTVLFAFIYYPLKLHFFVNYNQRLRPGLVSDIALAVAE